MRLLLSLFILSAIVVATRGDECASLGRDACQSNLNCQYLSFLSCCGDSQQFCVSNQNCAQQISCGKDAGGKIWEFWTSCKPLGFTDYRIPNDTCESLRCEAQGRTCEWAPSEPCYGTSCCPRVARCSGSSSSSSSTSGGIDLCNGYQCPGGMHCIVDNNQAKCIYTSSGSSSSSSSSSGSSTSGGIDLCNGVVCPGGTHCIVDNNQAKCIYTSSGASSGTSGTSSGSSGTTGSLCSILECPEGYECVVRNGRATCILCEPQPPVTCEHLKCANGFECLMINNVATCIAKDVCAGVVCQAGFTCKNQGGSACCVKPTNCSQLTCGEECLINPDCTLFTTKSCCGADLKVCVNKRPEGCFDLPEVQCGVYSRNGEIYEIANTCFPREDFIQYFPIRSRETCQTLNCELLGLECRYVNTSKCANEPCCPTVPGCFPRATVPIDPECPPQTCDTLRCAADEACCQPSPNLEARCLKLCDFANCAPGTKCILVNSQPQCIAGI
ncbi:hypothetical protein SAMD00019534_104150 [Acytostelium subglobosum LB1]|uniref:Spore coat protein D2 n=1 Tax=Acytostelium subglobosum TaxID=361139 RepID=R4X4R1_ACYSU|nr:hypothetical protein SAMD00019534_104150 [Acytostelium subglobosum LB1]BAN28456.1 spore coat protein D2 [Acytostelium subglobosum]GAM27240.1 hypothetical protein SAMD00019534_104150 [Acytostelium subglobosum LB1]|eukprot:XP_012749707.1 hypothetical protein SAMD00019534_104150 [Acytostelium subglobosum LB1]